MNPRTTRTIDRHAATLLTNDASARPPRPVVASSRRTFIAALAACASLGTNRQAPAAPPAEANPAGSGSSAPAAPRVAPLGLLLYSFSIRLDNERQVPPEQRISDPLHFLGACRKLGAAGGQLPLGVRDAQYARRVRRLLERDALYLEGTIRLPRDRHDIERFRAEIESAQRMGVDVLRCAMGGRRYEQFATLHEYRDFAFSCYEGLGLAAPVLEQTGMRLAVENHKDWLVPELIDLLRRVGSSQIGVCVDTGNSLALLEEPYEVVRQLAPLAFTTHLKDMAVREYDQGFLLSEVPLGTGLLDMPRIVALLRAEQPQVRLNLEMITRDPLRIPCLTDRYWATFADRPNSGLALARTLSMVRQQRERPPVADVSPLPLVEQLAIERQHVQRSLDFARAELSAPAQPR